MIHYDSREFINHDKLVGREERGSRAMESQTQTRPQRSEEGEGTPKDQLQFIQTRLTESGSSDTCSTVADARFPSSGQRRGLRACAARLQRRAHYEVKPEFKCVIITTILRLLIENTWHLLKQTAVMQ